MVESKENVLLRTAVEQALAALQSADNDPLAAIAACETALQYERARSTPKDDHVELVEELEAKLEEAQNDLAYTRAQLRDEQDEAQRCYLNLTWAKDKIDGLTPFEKMYGEAEEYIQQLKGELGEARERVTAAKVEASKPTLDSVGN